MKVTDKDGRLQKKMSIAKPVDEILESVLNDENYSIEKQEDHSLSEKFKENKEENTFLESVEVKKDTEKMSDLISIAKPVDDILESVLNDEKYSIEKQEDHVSEDNIDEVDVSVENGNQSTEENQPGVSDETETESLNGVSDKQSDDSYKENDNIGDNVSEDSVEFVNELLPSQNLQHVTKVCLYNCYKKAEKNTLVTFLFQKLKTVL